MHEDTVFSKHTKRKKCNVKERGCQYKACLSDEEFAEIGIWLSKPWVRSSFHQGWTLKQHSNFSLRLFFGTKDLTLMPLLW